MSRAPGRPESELPEYSLLWVHTLHLEVELESALGLEPGELERGGLSSKEGEEARGEHGGEHGADRDGRVSARVSPR